MVKVPGHLGGPDLRGVREGVEGAQGGCAGLGPLLVHQADHLGAHLLRRHGRGGVLIGLLVGLLGLIGVLSLIGVLGLAGVLGLTRILGLAAAGARVQGVVLRAVVGHGAGAVLRRENVDDGSPPGLLSGGGIDIVAVLIDAVVAVSMDYIEVHGVPTLAHSGHHGGVAEIGGIDIRAGVGDQQDVAGLGGIAAAGEGGLGPAVGRRAELVGVGRRAVFQDAGGHARLPGTPGGELRAPAAAVGAYVAPVLGVVFAALAGTVQLIGAVALMVAHLGEGDGQDVLAIVPRELHVFQRRVVLAGFIGVGVLHGGLFLVLLVLVLLVLILLGLLGGGLGRRLAALPRRRGGNIVHGPVDDRAGLGPVHGGPAGEGLVAHAVQHAQGVAVQHGVLVLAGNPAPVLDGVLGRVPLVLGGPGVPRNQDVVEELGHVIAVQGLAAVGLPGGGAAAQAAHAAEEPRPAGGLHGGQVPGLAGEAVVGRQLRGVEAPGQHGDKLGAGQVVPGAEGPVAIALYNAQVAALFNLGPGPVVRGHVGELGSRRQGGDRKAQANRQSRQQCQESFSKSFSGARDAGPEGPLRRGTPLDRDGGIVVVRPEGLFQRDSFLHGCSFFSSFERLTYI